MGERNSTKYKETATGMYLKTTGIKEDVKQIVTDLARIVAPGPLKSRGDKVDDVVSRASAQSSDSGNKY